MMITITVLGILTSMAVLGFGGPRQAAEDQKDKRNAQEIASLSAMASAAGADYVVEGDARATIGNLLEGVMPATGPFKERTFKLPEMLDGEITGALRFLVLSDDALQYRLDGNSLAMP